MAKFICNPIEVDAFQIISVSECADGSGLSLVLDNGECVTVDEGKTSRMFPVQGDYLVRTHKPDEYEYLNPKHVFEAKYTKI